jgi:hypothetical protein
VSRRLARERQLLHPLRSRSWQHPGNTGTFKPLRSRPTRGTGRAPRVMIADPAIRSGSGWQLIAAAGKDGRDGATGPRGERGERGLIGPRGEPAPTITGWRVDCAAYAAVPLLSDGSEGAPLALRSLFKQFLDEVAPRA